MNTRIEDSNEEDERSNSPLYPPVTLQLVFEYLNARDLLAAGQANVAWCNAANNTSLWKRLTTGTIESDVVHDYKLMAQIIARSPVTIVLPTADEDIRIHPLNVVKMVANSLKCQPIDIIRFLSKINYLNSLIEHQLGSENEILSFLGFVELLVNKFKMPFAEAAGMTCHIFAARLELPMQLLLASSNDVSCEQLFMSGKNDFYATFVAVSLYLMANNSAWGGDNPRSDFIKAMNAVSAFYEKRNDDKLIEDIINNSGALTEASSKFSLFGKPEYDDFIMSIILMERLAREDVNDILAAIKETANANKCNIFELVCSLLAQAQQMNMDINLMTSDEIILLINSANINRNGDQLIVDLLATPPQPKQPHI
jgi:hypothetical protein